METTLGHYGNWLGVIIWIIIYSVFLLFLPFYKKSRQKSSSVYFAFIVAFALEMFGIPMSMYFVAWLFGYTLPEGFLWGHTLVNYIGHWGMYIAIVLTFVGLFLIVKGWRDIYKYYWSKVEGKGKLVTTGIYSYIRHPQYTGFLFITLGILIEWVTIPLLLMWPFLLVTYYRLARKEERDMEQEFGEAYTIYKDRTGMFLPL